MWYAFCHSRSIPGGIQGGQSGNYFQADPNSSFIRYRRCIPFRYPAKILTWSSPSEYTNGTSLNPVTDLDRFEIYVNEDGVFSDTDNEMAAVSATVPGTGQPATSFNLAKLAPFLSQGVTYHVAIRTVALNGLKSGFSAGATFSF